MTEPLIQQIINTLKDTLNLKVIPFLFVLATAVFIWGIIQYIIKSEDQAAQKRAKAIITIGIIGLTVLLAVWGIVNLLTLYFGVGGTGIPTPNPLIL